MSTQVVIFMYMFILNNSDNFAEMNNHIPLSKEKYANAAKSSEHPIVIFLKRKGYKKVIKTRVSKKLVIKTI